MSENKKLNYTKYAMDALNEERRKIEKIRSCDSAEEIKRFLVEGCDFTRFDCYLKRFIYIKLLADTGRSFDTFKDSEFTSVLNRQFKAKKIDTVLTREKKCEVSASSLKALAGQWIKGKKVPRRDNIFLIAFAIDLSGDQLDELLVKAAHTQGVYFRNYSEAICYFVLNNWKDTADTQGTTYQKAKILCENYRTYRERLQKIDPNTGINKTEYMKALFKRKSPDFDPDTDPDKYIDQIIRTYNLDLSANQSETALRLFRKECIGKFQRMKEGEYRAYDGFSPEDISEIFNKDEIPTGTAYSIESLLYPGVKKNGNLLAYNDSEIAGAMKTAEKLNRKRISKIIDPSEKWNIQREDFLNLIFHIVIMKKFDSTPQNRLKYFVSEANDILERAGYGQIYPANPYDTVLMLCLATEDPIYTYKNILKMATEEKSEEKSEESEDED